MCIHYGFFIVASFLTPGNHLPSRFHASYWIRSCIPGVMACHFEILRSSLYFTIKSPKNTASPFPQSPLVLQRRLDVSEHGDSPPDSSSRNARSPIVCKSLLAILRAAYTATCPSFYSCSFARKSSTNVFPVNQKNHAAGDSWRLRRRATNSE